MKFIKRYITTVFVAVAATLHANSNEEFNAFLDTYLQPQDSIILKIPLEYQPRYIYDLVFSEENIYVCAEAEYPLLKFDRTGKFIKAIGKKGNGPEEFPMNPRKICYNKSDGTLFLTDGPMGITLYVVKRDVISSRVTDAKFVRVVDVEIINNQLILAFSANAKWHIKISNTKELAFNDHQPLPESASMLRLVASPFWALQKTDDYSFITHYGYPFEVFKYNISGQGLKRTTIFNGWKSTNNFRMLSEDISANTVLKSGHDPFSMYKKISICDWIIANKKNQYLGSYWSVDEKTDMHFATLFVIENGKIVIERRLPQHLLGNIIPVDNKLYFYEFLDFANSSDIVLKPYGFK